MLIDRGTLAGALLAILGDRCKIADARLTADVWREGEPYADRQRWREEMVAAAWNNGRADRRIADELDRFMTAAGSRLGEEGVRTALRAAGSGSRMAVPGLVLAPNAGLEVLARSCWLQHCC